VTAETGAALQPADIAAGIEQAWESWLLRGRRGAMPHGHVWASAYRVCERRMVYEMTCPDQQLPFDAKALARFRRGDDRERDLLVDLARISRDAEPPFDVIGQQERFELKDRKGRVAIAGKVDARLRFDRRAAPIEVKAWSPNIVDRIETFEDLFENPWTRSGAHQLLSYLYGANEPFGFLLLDRSGLPLLLPVQLDANLDRMEDFLSRAERAVDHQQAGTLPAFTEDAVECGRCPFYGTVCHPPRAAEPTHVLVDPVLEANLERWNEIQTVGREWSALDALIKKQLRGVESGIAGHFAIAGKWGKQSRVDLPPDLKKQFTVTDPRGRFTLEITRL
jgi:hypothetical protein